MRYFSNAKHPGSAGYKQTVAAYCGREKYRFWELDFVRGLCVLLMVFDHCMYCFCDVLPSANQMFGTSFLSELAPVAIKYWNSAFRNNIRLVVVSAFFIICGISCTLTRGNFRRFIPLAIVAGGISAVTTVLDQLVLPGAQVRFGVIHMLAAGVFLYAVLDEAAVSVGSVLGKGKKANFTREALRYLPGLVGLILLCWLFFGGFARFSHESGYWDVVGNFSPQNATGTEKDIYSVFLYVKNYYFRSGDYFPILPWSALVLAGGILGRLIYHTSAKYAFRPLDGAWNRGMCIIGRHAAVIYVAHMIVIPLYFALGAYLFSLL